MIADLQERRDQRDLREVVPQADPAQGHQPQRADERAVQEGRRQPDRQRRSGGVLSAVEAAPASAIAMHAASRPSLIADDAANLPGGRGVNYNWNWGDLLPDVARRRAHLSRRRCCSAPAGRWRPRSSPGAWRSSSARSSASCAPRRIPGWSGSATPMSNCSATFRCWCRCSSGTSCCRSSCRPTIGDWLKQLPDASFYTAVVALGFYTSARVAEQVRAGILSLAARPAHGRRSRSG